MTSKTIAFKTPTHAAPAAEKWVETRTRPEPVAPIKRLTLDIPADLHRKLKTHCAATGLNMADLCRDLIVKALPSDAA
jgi:hypothetical protein